MGADLFGPLWDTISLDPPWAENGGGVCKRGADRWYPTVPTDQLPRIITESGVWRPNEDRCNIWMWTTANFLKDALWVLKDLGVHYVTNLVWVKTHKATDEIALEALEQANVKVGLGQHFRLAHEHLLYGRIGRVPVPAPADRLPTVVVAAPGDHSAKPARFRTIMERHDGAGAKLEMFAREDAAGWKCWGPHAGLEVAHADT